MCLSRLLLAGAHTHHTAIGSGHRPLDQQQILILDEPHHFKIASRHLCIAILPGHFRVFKNSTGIRASPDRTTTTKRLVRSMGAGLARKSMAFHHAGKATALRSSRDINSVNLDKNITRNFLPFLKPFKS